MKPEEIKAFLITQGFTQDRWGHMKREFPNKIRRYKFQKISLRIEVKANRPGAQWLNENYERTVYYKDLEIVKGKLVIF